MEINDTPVSQGAERLINNYKFSLKSFTGVENLLLDVLQLHDEKHLKKRELKKILDNCLNKNETNSKDIFYLCVDDIEIPWFENNREKILSRDVRNTAKSFQQELDDLRKDIQYMLFKNTTYQELLAPDIQSMTFSNGKVTYSFSDIEDYIGNYGFMYERGANCKIMPERINDVKIEFREDYFDKPCVVLHVFYVDDFGYVEDVIPLIFFSLPIDPQKNFPYITCFNDGVISTIKENQTEKNGKNIF